MMAMEMIACEAAPIAYQAVSIASHWIFRGMSEVYSWQPNDPEKLAWTYSLPDDRRFGHKQLLAADDLVITFADRGTAGSRLVALSPTLGELVWEISLDLQLLKTGICHFHGQLHVYGTNPERKYIHVVIELATGKEQSRFLCRQGDTIVAAGEHLFLASADGLYATDANSSSMFELIEPFHGRISSLTAFADNLCFLFEDETSDWEYRFAVYNSQSKFYTLSTIEVSRAQIFPTPLDQDSLVLLPGEGLGVIVFDWVQQKIRWCRGQQESWCGSKAVVTPSGIFLLVDANDGTKQVKRFQSNIGTELPVPEFTQPLSLHWFDDYLLVTGQFGIQAIREF